MSIDFTGKDPATNGSEGPTSNPGDSQNNSPADKLDVIEYEGRKLTKDDVLKKLKNADTFIETLKAEREADRKAMADLTEQVKKSADISELLKAMKEDRPASTTEVQAPVVNKDELLREIKDSLRQENQQEGLRVKQEENWKSVTSELTKAFGAKTQERVTKAAEAHNLTLEEARDLAVTRPSVFLAMFPEIKARDIKSPLPSGGSKNFNFNGNTSGNPKKLHEARNSKEKIAIYLEKLASTANE